MYEKLCTERYKCKNEYRRAKQKRADDKKQITADAKKNSNLLSVTYQPIANGIDDVAMQLNSIVCLKPATGSCWSSRYVVDASNCGCIEIIGELCFGSG